MANQEIKLTDKILLTVPEVAQLLNTRPDNVRNLMKHGYLSGLKLGEIKVRRATVDKFLEEFDGQDLNDLSNVRPLTFGEKK